MLSALEAGPGLRADAGDAEVAGEGVQGAGGPWRQPPGRLEVGSLSSGQSVIRWVTEPEKNSSRC